MRYIAQKLLNLFLIISWHLNSYLGGEIWIGNDKKDLIYKAPRGKHWGTTDGKIV